MTRRGRRRPGESDERPVGKHPRAWPLRPRGCRRSGSGHSYPFLNTQAGHGARGATLRPCARSWRTAPRGQRALTLAQVDRRGAIGAGLRPHPYGRGPRHPHARQSAGRDRPALPPPRGGGGGLRHLPHRPERPDRQLEPRRAEAQGLRGRGGDRPALLPLLHRGGPPPRQARGGPGDRPPPRPLRGRGLARAQGRHPLLGARGARRRARPGRHRDRLRQDHPRHDRAPGGAAGPRRERAALPPARAGRDRLRHLHARPRGQGRQLERGRAADQGLGGGGDRRPALLPLLHRGGPRRRGAASGRWSRPSGPGGSRPRAGACARTAAASGPAW